MKKLFGQTKQKTSKGISSRDFEDLPTPTPVHQQHAVFHSQPAALQPPLQQTQSTHVNQTFASPTPRPVRRSPTEEERWEVVPTQEDAQMRSFYQATSAQSRNSSYGSLPPGASPPANGPRSPSPFSVSTISSTPTAKPNPSRDREYQPPQQQQQMLRKKPQTSAPVALGILRSLDPPRSETPKTSMDEKGVTMPSSYDTGHKDRDKEPGEKRDKWSFWKGDRERDKERDKDKEKKQQERDRDRGKESGRLADGQNELTRMIGYLTATASEDWGLVLEVCERASANEVNAKEAVRALRREFKYGEPAAQLSAARLWAIMLRNSSELFVTQSTTRKFLDTLEDLLNNPRTSPVVKERVLDVIAAAAYASGSKRETGFRGIWRRVKPADKPDEGVPLDNDDAMLNPPISASRFAYFDVPQVAYPGSSPILIDQNHNHIPATPVLLPKKRNKSPTRNRIIPRDEDIRRLFQECNLGQGNAALLTQAITLSRPEDLKKKDVIKEFYTKCRQSQELIFAQIPWASSGAEQSRTAKNQEIIANGGTPDEVPTEQTIEEKLLDALLAANAELVDALQQYDDMERVALERQAEDISRKETKMDWKQYQQLRSEGPRGQSSDRYSSHGSSSPSPSRSPSPLSSAYAHHPHAEVNNLAPPPPAPHGPRLPSQTAAYSYSRSRTPSPSTPVLDHHQHHLKDSEHQDPSEGINSLRIRSRRDSYDSHVQFHSPELDDDDETPIKPSAKALGKRRVIEEPAEENPGDEDTHFGDKDVFHPEDQQDIDDSDGDGWHNHQRPVQYVYDAAAERTKQRIQEAQVSLQGPLVNGLH